MAPKTYDHYIFFCQPCFEIWPYHLEDKQKITVDSTDYCPNCDSLIEAVLEESWMESMVKLQHHPDKIKQRRIAGSHPNHRGPSTPEAKQRSSNNAWKSGAFAQKNALPPARPGRYKDCETCPIGPQSDLNPHADNSCALKKHLYCSKQLPAMIAMINAHHGGGPAALRDMIARAQGMAAINLETALQQVAMQGPTVERTHTRYNKDGDIESEDIRIEPHPALISIQTHSGLLGTRLPDWHLTPQSVGQADKDNSVKEAIEEMFRMFGKNPPPEYTQPLEIISPQS